MWKNKVVALAVMFYVLIICLTVIPFLTYNLGYNRGWVAGVKWDDEALNIALEEFIKKHNGEVITYDHTKFPKK